MERELIAVQNLADVLGEIVAVNVSLEDYMEHYAEQHCEWVEGVVINPCANYPWFRSIAGHDYPARRLHSDGLISRSRSHVKIITGERDVPVTDVQQLLSEIDRLSDDELETVYRHVVQRRQPTYWLIPGENLKAIQEIMRPVYEQSLQMSDEEIDLAIDEALDEVRCKHG